MKTIEVPFSFSWRITAISSSISAGVSTAVGSSRISTLASLVSALMISTRCCTPTGMSSTSASGSTSNPYRSDSSVTSASAFFRSRMPPGWVFSRPSMMFSATVNTGTSMKCWCTMPMPVLDRVARRGDPDLLAVDQDLAGVGLQQPVEHVHQRALAGAVLTEQAVDLARLDHQVDVVVGDQRAEALGQAGQLEMHAGSLPSDDEPGRLTCVVSRLPGSHRTTQVRCGSGRLRLYLRLRS